MSLPMTQELLPAWQPAMLLSFLDTTGQRIAASTAELWPLLESRLIAAKQRVPSLVWRCRPAGRLEEGAADCCGSANIARLS